MTLFFIMFCKLINFCENCQKSICIFFKMVAELKHVASDCPDGFTCEVFSIGQTYEKNNLTILHVNIFRKIIKIIF